MTINTAADDAAMQGTRDASIRKTIEFAARNAKCPICGEHPTDCICYGRFGKATLKALPQVKTWQPWKKDALLVK